MTGIPFIDKDDFQTEVLEAELPVLVDFWAAWCGPCQMFAPVVQAISQTYAEKLKVVKVNVDEQPELSEQFEVMSIPTLVLFSQGEQVDTLVGAMPQNAVEAWLKEQLSL